MKKRKLNLIEAENEIVEIEDCGHKVSRMTDYHWRIDEYIDIWPSSKKFMKLDGNFKVHIYKRIRDIFV